MWSDIVVAIALLMVVEGFVPSVSPKGWRAMLKRLIAQSDATLRGMGLLSMGVGALLLYIIRRT